MDVAIRALHLIAAAVWAGGLVMLGVAALAARAALGPRERVAFFRVAGRGFAALAVAAAAILAATGADLASDSLASWSELVDTGYGRELLAKLVLFALALIEAGVHGAVLGPRISRTREALAANPGDPELEARLRRTAATSGVVSMLILVQTLAILVLAAALGT